MGGQRAPRAQALRVELRRRLHGEVLVRAEHARERVDAQLLAEDEALADLARARRVFRSAGLQRFLDAAVCLACYADVSECAARSDVSVERVWRIVRISNALLHPVRAGMSFTAVPTMFSNIGSTQKNYENMAALLQSQ